MSSKKDLTNSQKEQLREYLNITSTFSKFDDDYTINDFYQEYNLDKEKFYNMQELAIRYLKKKYILDVSFDEINQN